MKNLVIKATILECKEGTFTPEAGGKAVEWKTALVMVEDKVLKFKSRVDLKGYIKTEVDLELEIFAGAGLAAGLRVVGVKE